MAENSDKQKKHTSRLASLLDPGTDTSAEWDEQDLASILRHQLSAPIETSIQHVSAEIAEELRTFCSSESLRLNSFRDLLFHEHPPIELLKIIKNFGKKAARNRNGGLPPDIAGVFYYTSIAAALDKHHRKITSLDDDKLLEGLHWTLSHPWLDEDVQDLCQRAVTVVEQV